MSDWRWRRKSSLPLGQLPFPDFVRFVVKLVSPKEEGSSEEKQGSWDATVPQKEFAEQYLGHFKAQVFCEGIASQRKVYFMFLREAIETMTFASPELHVYVPALIN